MPENTTRRQFLKAAGAAAAAAMLPTLSCAAQNKKPNILLIVGDDIGFSDIGCYGAEINTPNLDRLAANGMRFTQFYNMAKCNPTRSSLFTGLYKGDERAISFVSLLRDAGYTTLHSGKEHFDDWVPKRCYAENTCDRSLTFWASTEYFVPPSGKFKRPFKLNGRELSTNEVEAFGGQKPFYKTDAFTDTALKWLDEALQQDKPFFLALPYHAAHYPLQAFSWRCPITRRTIRCRRDRRTLRNIVENTAAAGTPFDRNDSNGRKSWASFPTMQNSVRRKATSTNFAATPRALKRSGKNFRCIDPGIH